MSARLILLATTGVVVLVGSLCIGSPPESADNASAVARTIRQLQRIKTDEFATDVPSGVWPGMKELKHELRDLLLAVLNSSSPEKTDPETVRATLLASLKDAGVSILQDCDTSMDGRYGRIHDVTLRSVEGHPALLVATVALGIPYGIDTSLYVFESEQNDWHLLLAYESNDYSSIHKGRMALDYAISPSNRDGKWFLVVASFSPWPTSCWNNLHYEVLRAGTSPDKPKVLLVRDEFAYRCEERLFELEAQNDGIAVGYYAYVETDAVTSFKTKKYTVSGDRVTELHP